MAGYRAAGLGHLPAGQPGGQVQQFPAGGTEGPGLLPAPAPGGVAGHPDGDLDCGLGDVQPGHPIGEQRLVSGLLPSPAPTMTTVAEAAAARGSQGQSGKSGPRARNTIQRPW
jgi:hypothetical protein